MCDGRLTNPQQAHWKASVEISRESHVSIMDTGLFENKNKTFW